MPKKDNTTPETLRPYIKHGVNLDWKEGDKDATGDCPWCGKEGHFNVSIKTSLCRCLVCGEGTAKGGMNPRLFIRKLHAESIAVPQDYSSLVKDRRVSEDTLREWQVCKSFLSGVWLVPGYGADGAMNQLYRYVRVNERSVLIPTDTLGHAVHGVNIYDKKCETVDLCEGPWDAMALWETMGECMWTVSDGVKLVSTPNRADSLLSFHSVLAIPGCTTFFKSWLPLFAGKEVNLWFDNDHPRRNPKTGKLIEPAGLTGMKRVAGMLSSAANPPSAIRYMAWGDDGATYDKNLPDGCDVRDYLYYDEMIDAAFSQMSDQQ